MFNSKYLILITILGVISLFSSCKKKDKDETNNPDTEFDRKEMLSNIGRNIIMPNYLNFKNQTEILDNKIQAFSANPVENSLVEAQNAFEETYKAWQKVSIFNLGPAEAEALRTYINVFPTDTNQINSNISTGQYDFATLQNIDAQGLPALDYLLYGTSDNSLILSLFTTDQNAANRKAYLSALSSKIKNKANSVYNAWNAGYLETFVNSTGSDVGSSIGMLVNEFNYDLEMIKTNKLGIPLGKQTLGDKLPAKAEAYYSGISVDLAVIQAENIRDVFQGLGGLGLDDYLNFLEAKAYNGSPLTDVINTQLNSIIQKLQAIPSPLSNTVISNPASADAAYAEIQRSIVYTKTDMPSALGVMITYQDNDGD